MRQPASLSNARPRHDHHEYGPATSGWSFRTTSTQPVDISSVSHCRSLGRNPDFLTLPRQFLMSINVDKSYTSRGTHDDHINHPPGHPPPLPAAEHIMPRDNGGYGCHEVAKVTLG